MEWPKSRDYPNGPFCTSGFGASLLRRELRKHIHETESYMRPDLWVGGIEYDYMQALRLYYNPPPPPDPAPEDDP